MIQHIDRALEQHLRERVPLPESSIGVSFDAPDKTWGAALNRPTVNIFLWNLAKSGTSTASGIEMRHGSAGIERRWTNPTVELHYLITAWATELRDEHQLLGDILQTILTHRQLPEDLVPADVAAGACSLNLAGADEHVPGEFWSALGGRLKPGLQLRLSVPVELYQWAPTAPVPDSVEVDVDPRPGRRIAAQPSPPRWAAAPTNSPQRVRRVRAAIVEEQGPQSGPQTPTNLSSESLPDRG